MKKLMILSYIVCIFLGSIPVLAQTKFEEIRSKWSEKKYKEVIQLGKAYRNTFKGKGIPALDYMILSSICLTSTDRDKTCEQVSAIIDGYYTSMDPSEQLVLKRGLFKVCQSGEVELNLLASRSNSRQSGQSQEGRVAGSYKTFMLISESLEKEGIFKSMGPDVFSYIYRDKSTEVTNLPATGNNSPTTLINDRVAKADTVALQKRLGRFGKSTKYLTSENFLIIADKSTPLNLSTVSDNLEKVLAFYSRSFQMDMPEDYIVINLIQDYNAVRPFIGRYYQNNITFEPLGYSSPEDNTIIAWIPASDMIGTLKHELIHVLIKSTFNFIPQWFEEGLASLYEESQFSEQMLVGKKNWRGAILKENFINFPIDSLIKGANYTFSAEQRARIKFDFIRYIKNGSSRTSYLRQMYQEHAHELSPILDVFLENYLSHYKYALSRYFILYMQDTGNLSNFYSALLKRDREILDMKETKSDSELLCESFNKEIPEMIYLDFYDWLENLKS
nr:hypothetical protein [Pedobacter panaciterrae]